MNLFNGVGNLTKDPELKAAARAARAAAAARAGAMAAATAVEAAWAARAAETIPVESLLLQAIREEAPSPPVRVAGAGPLEPQDARPPGDKER